MKSFFVSRSNTSLAGYSSENESITECQKMVTIVTTGGCNSNHWCQFSLNLYNN